MPGLSRPSASLLVPCGAVTTLRVTQHPPGIAQREPGDSAPADVSSMKQLHGGNSEATCRVGYSRDGWRNPRRLLRRGRWRPRWRVWRLSPSLLPRRLLPLSVARMREGCGGGRSPFRASRQPPQQACARATGEVFSARRGLSRLQGQPLPPAGDRAERDASLGGGARLAGDDAARAAADRGVHVGEIDAGGVERAADAALVVVAVEHEARIALREPGEQQAAHLLHRFGIAAALAFDDLDEALMMRLADIAESGHRRAPDDRRSVDDIAPPRPAQDE